jgi:ATP-binding cassette subfamily C protein CydC
VALLDEPTEGLDTKAEALLGESLAEWLDHTGAGLLLISHRPAMWRLASKIFEIPTGEPTSLPDISNT